MPTEKWLVKWKRNRNHRGEEIVFSQKIAAELADKKKSLGFKVKMEKVSRVSSPSPPKEETEKGKRREGFFFNRKANTSLRQ